MQLPAWNEALGLPRPWDQQWSLRMQQVLAFESDLLEYDDLFAGSLVVEAKVAELVEGARAEIDRVQEHGRRGGGGRAGYLKSALVAAHSARRRRIESGEDVVVGVNRFAEHRAEPARRPTSDARSRGSTRRRGRRRRRPWRTWRAERDADRRREPAAALAAAARRGRDRRQPDGGHACGAPGPG